MSNQEEVFSIFEIQMTERDSTLNPRQLRTAGFVPGTLYSKDVDAQNVQVRTVELEEALRKGRRYFELQGAGFDGKAAHARQIQVHPVSQQVLNVEFLQIDLKAAKAAGQERADALLQQQAEAEAAEAEARKAAAKAAAAESEASSDEGAGETEAPASEEAPKDEA